jgi:hypothetical protein
VVVTGGLWSKLEAVGMTIEMSSGICADSLVEPVEFALGPTMVTRRERVEEMGGFESMAEYCADDFVLGIWIAKNGHKVVLSGHAIDHMVLQADFVDSMKHQVRWMKSTRFSRPKGHFGTGLTGDASARLVRVGRQCVGTKSSGVGGGTVCGAGETHLDGDGFVSGSRSDWCVDLGAELCEQPDSVARRSVRTSGWRADAAHCGGESSFGYGAVCLGP